MNQDFNNNNINENNNNLNNNSNISFQNNLNTNNQQINDSTTSSYNRYQQQKNTYQPIGNNDNVDEKINTPKKKINIGLIIGMVIIIIIVILGIILLSNLSKKKENVNVNDEKATVSEKSESTPSTSKQLIVYLNNLKITLGKTTMDEIVKNTDLKVIKDEISKSSGYTSDGNREKVIEYNKREVVLSDDINVIIFKSYFEKTNIVGEISTLRNNQVDDPVFDNSKGTTLSFEDAIIGKKMNIGDTFTQDEFYDDLTKGYCYSYSHIIYCPQTKHLSDDKFIYYFDDNYKIVNMSATLMGYYG